MTTRANCWEVQSCGREPGGHSVRELGVCPAAADQRLDGVNNGKAGGRACWAITGTLCDGTVQGTFASKIGACMRCSFYKTVVKEERGSLTSAREIQERLHADGGREGPA
jgi:hypothetical protein